MKKRLLIVDDDVDLLESLKLLLETSFDVCLTRSGPEAFFEMDRGFHPDAIVLDYYMPGMNGPEFLAELKRREKQIPVLVVTANWDAAAQSPDMADQEILRKPFTYEQLREKLDRVMRGSGGGTPARMGFLASLLIALSHAILTGRLL
jgi:DNA-binding response OmpR family regulator